MLAEIERKNRDVAAYLRKRRDKIEAASFLEPDRRRGGRITSQLVESFFNMIRPFREMGLVEGVVWMCKKFQEIQLEERESLKRWQSKDYKGERIMCLSRVASAKFFEVVGWRDDDAFKVENLQSTDVELVGDVVKKADGSVRHIRISRAEVGARIVIDCPCLTRQELGFPCARATRLLIDGGWCTQGLPAGAVAEYISADAWRMQTAVNIVVPAEPVWLSAFNKQNPPASLRALVLEEGALKLLPGRVPVPAGRPKLVKRLKKQFNSHFARLKSATEKGDAKRKPKAEIESRAEGDDDDIVEDWDVPEVPLNEKSSEEDESDGGRDDEPEGSPGKEMVVVPKVVKAFADLWLVGNDARSKKRKEAECSSCGAAGHKWPKCRARNIELMLVNIGAMPSEPLELPQPCPGQVSKVTEPSLVREVIEAFPELPDVELASEKIAEKSRKAKKREKVVTCMSCKGDTLHESWRLFGMRCSACRDCFIHFVCARTSDWTCDECRAGGSVAE